MSKKAAKEAIDANFSHYTGMSGLLDVREAAAYFMKEKYHLTYQPGTEIFSNSWSNRSDFSFVISNFRTR